MKTWLTVSEAAQHAGVSRDTIYTACERREIRHARVCGRRAIRLKPEWIDAWLEQHSRGAHHAATSAGVLERARPTTAVPPPARGLAQEGRS
jgi:excisionase family DNA binding protein